MRQTKLITRMIWRSFGFAIKIFMTSGIALTAYMFPSFETAEALLKKTSGTQK